MERPVTIRTYVLNHDKTVEPMADTVEPMADTVEWSRRFEMDNRVVAQDEIKVPGNPKPVIVLTVFNGIDLGEGRHAGPPLLFETAVYGGRLDMLKERYTTYADAQRGHARWVDQVKAEG